jgi:hypothetical protein
MSNDSGGVDLKENNLPGPNLGLFHELLLPLAAAHQEVYVDRASIGIVWT